MAHMPYRDDPQQSQVDLQQYYDNAGPSQSIPMQERYQDAPMNGAGGGGYGYSQHLAANSSRDNMVSEPLQPNNNWLDNSATRERAGRPKWLMIAAAVGLLALIGAGVGVGVYFAKKHSSNDSSKSSLSSSSSSSGSSGSSGDPSNFEKNPALIQSFYGIAYTPEGSQTPECGNNIDQVITDIQLLSQLTTRIRLYGADCNQTQLVLDAIHQTKVNMTVYIANYITTNSSDYTRQMNEIENAISLFGSDHIGGYTVGNEFILDYLTDNSATDPNGAVGNAGAQILIGDITSAKSTMSGLGLSNITIGTADAGAYFNNEVLEAVDYGMANVHPWFAGTTIEDAASWTFEFFVDTNIAQANNVSNKPDMSIAETGWPTNSTGASTETNGASAASVANLQTFLDNFVCQANANNTQYFFFEYFDETWKDIQFGGVEGWWGLFHANRTLKDITIPKCD
uniref:glucan endo-1,3-beta-D-glucosidase n=1 Tax=Mycena chlorophos TaxID=658473 RepID=A0ABQ0LCB2_MYCCL|nr:glycoside hydrolase family 17 protein [Mycena chlorophos]